MTPRQIQIIAGLARGKTHHTIATALCVSRWTVRQDVPRAIRSAGISTPEFGPALVDYAYRHGLLASLTPEVRPPVTLTVRQFEVLTLLAAGTSNAQIGARLCMPVDTVKSIVRRLYGRLGAQSRAHAVALAWQQGLLGAESEQVAA